MTDKTSQHEVTVSRTVDLPADAERIEEYCRANYSEDDSAILQNRDDGKAYQYKDGDFSVLHAVQEGESDG